MIPSQAYLRSILDYNPDTGRLTWKQSKRRKHKGVEAGYIKRQKNHNSRSINIDGRIHKADRIIYRLTTGEWPVDVAHLNGDYTDCSWTNMRAVDFPILRKVAAKAKKQRLYPLPKSFEESLERWRAA